MSLLLGSFNPRDSLSLLDAISTLKGREKVVSLKGDEAEVALTLMQKELDASGSHHGTKGLFNAIIHLANGSRRVPSNLLLSDIQQGEQVASGSYGVVYKGLWKGEAVALKFPLVSVKDNFKQFVHEVILWRRLSHKNVLSFLGLYQDGPKKAMVAPWQSGGNVVEFISEFPNADRYRLLVEAADGLAYLHGLEPPIVHSDLKPENILISHDHTAMLADFGLSHMQRDLTELISSDLCGTKGTLAYCAPELLEETPGPCEPSRDIWAFGMVIYRVFTGEPPYWERLYPVGIMTAIKSGDRPKARKSIAKKRGFTDELWKFSENDCWKMTQGERSSARDCGARLTVLRSRWKEKTAKAASPVENLVEETIPAPPSYCGPLVTRRKQYVQYLKEQFDVSVKVDHETYAMIKIVGDRSDVQEAIRDITSDRDNMSSPEASDSLSIPFRLKGLIIGRGGESVKALEKEFSVRIQVGDISGEAKLRGPPNNVAEVKARLQSMLEYHQLYDDVCEIHVGQKLIKRLQASVCRRDTCERLGLKNLHILSESDTSITMRGPKSALEKAQTHFHRLQEKMDREITLTLNKDIQQLSRLVKGQAWPRIVLKCNGPSDPNLQKDLFTLREEEKELVLTGEAALVEQLKEELVLEVERQREIVLGMEIPSNLHGFLLLEHDIKGIQREARVSICFPGLRGSRDYDTLSDPQNLLDDLFEVDTEDIVKIRGTREACITARKMLKTEVEQEKRLRRCVTFGAKYASRLKQYGEVRRLVDKKLRALGIRVLLPHRLYSTYPISPCIRLAPLPQTPWITWGQIRRFDLEDKEKCTLNLRATTKHLDEAVHVFKQAVQKVSAASYMGRLKFSTSTKFGKLIGTNGATVRRLENETDTTIKLDGTIVDIIGSKKNVMSAKRKILGLFEANWITAGDDF